MKRLFRWIADIGAWLLAGWKGYVFLLLACIAIFIVLYWQSECAIIYAGLFLQLVGMIVTIISLDGLRRHFKHPSLFSLMTQWVKRFPKWNRHIVAHLEGGHFSMIGGNARFSMWKEDDESSSTEERLSSIIKNLKFLRSKVDDDARAFEEWRNSHDGLHKKIEKDAQTVKDDLRAETELLHTGSFVETMLGLILLTLGMILSTTAPDLASLFK
jgi:hypothetical protein